jgi:flagellin
MVYPLIRTGADPDEEIPRFRLETLEYLTMALTVNTNIASLNAQRNLTKSGSDLNVSLQRLSTGLRINSAKDDAAGLAISERFTTQIRGLNQAIRNSNDGVSLAQTAEGALSESGNLLQRIRELAIQSSNATNSASDRAALQSEVNQLKTELQRTATTTSFNGLNILDGSYQNQVFQVGDQSGTDNQIQVSISDTRTTGLGVFTVAGASATNQDGLGSTSAGAATATAATATNVVNAQTLTIASSVGTSTVSVGDADSADVIATAVNAKAGTTGVSASAQTTATLGTLSDNGTVSFSVVTGDGTAAVSAAVTTGDLSNLADQINQFTGQTGVSASANGDTLTLTNGEGKDIGIENFVHSGNSAETAVFKGSAEGTGVTLTGPNSGTPNAADSAIATGEVTFTSSTGFNVQSDVANSAGSVVDSAAGTDVSSALSAVNAVDISTAQGALDSLDVLDGALAQISSIRADLGAIQSRFESVINNLSSTVENASAARSRIIDADFAAETAALTRNQILQQAGVAVLAQANGLPQLALSLLQ